MASAAYHVLGKHMSTDTRLNEAGTGIEDVHVIPYMIDSGPAQGSTRHVKVPHAQYSVPNVQSAIESDLEVAHGVASLKKQ
jgi:hypothetical protein